MGLPNLRLGGSTGGILNPPSPAQRGSDPVKVAPNREHGGRRLSFRVAGMKTQPAWAFQPPAFTQTRNGIVNSPCSDMAHLRFYSAHCSHPLTAPGAAQACPLCLPSGSNQRTGSGDFRLGCPVEKAFRYAFRTFQLGSFIQGTARSFLIFRHAFHVPGRRSTDPRTYEIHPSICHFAAGVSGFPAYALRFGQIGAPVMTTGIRVVHLNGLFASRPIQINVLTSRPAVPLRLLDVLSLMSAPCSGRQELRPLAPPLLTGPAHQLTCPRYAGSCRPIERAVRFASVPSQFGDFINLHSAFPPARVRNLAPVALICGHCSGRRARRFLGPSAFADAASQRSNPQTFGLHPPILSVLAFPQAPAPDAKKGRGHPPRPLNRCLRKPAPRLLHSPAPTSRSLHLCGRFTRTKRPTG